MAFYIRFVESFSSLFQQDDIIIFFIDSWVFLRCSGSNFSAGVLTSCYFRISGSFYSQQISCTYIIKFLDLLFNSKISLLCITYICASLRRSFLSLMHSNAWKRQKKPRSTKYVYPTLRISQIKY